MKKDTLLGHAGRNPQQTHGTVNMPVYRASTIVFPDLETYSTRPADDYKTPRYGIHGTPTTWALEEAVAKMEGGYNAVAVCSGLAAINAALCAFVKTGDHLLIADSVYGPTRNFCDKRLTTFGVEIQYYDPLIGAGIKNLIKSNTKAVFCEAPGSLSFEMQDIPAIAREAHDRHIPVLADTTWGTPYFFRSFEHGVDVSIHAGTKYIVGHSDVMLGMIVTNEQYWLPVRRTVAEYGYCSSADDCYLALRGFRTIGVRMKQQMTNAIRVARWLEQRAEVKRVLFPALESDPGHAIWKRDFEGAASLFSLVLNPVNKKQITAFVNALKLFGIGSSWGGYESLVTAPNIAPLRTATKWVADGPVIRLHIGLEDPEDLIADVSQAFAEMSAAG
ncbi:MAG TPA: cystathionine beta-lyase [Burkholderiales bacterium]|nr:cystathionine beta-lyase [Burkholderiales bacterium]